MFVCACVVRSQFSALRQVVRLLSSTGRESNIEKKEASTSFWQKRGRKEKAVSKRKLICAGVNGATKADARGRTHLRLYLFVASEQKLIAACN